MFAQYKLPFVKYFHMKKDESRTNGDYNMFQSMMESSINEYIESVKRVYNELKQYINYNEYKKSL